MGANEDRAAQTSRVQNHVLKGVPEQRHTPLSEDTKTKGIPPFILPLWLSEFLPALYRTLYCSREPFVQFRRNAKPEAIIQDQLDIILPGNSWEVKWGDAICQPVSQSVIRSL